MPFVHLFLVLSAGLALGYWMFGIRGAALFGGVAVICLLAHRFLARVAPRAGGAVLLAIAAILLVRCSALGWGAADAPDGSRYKVSPVGLSRVLTPNQPTSRTEDCGWYGASAYPRACEIADRDAFRELRAVYPLVLAAVTLCVLGVLFSGARAAWSARAQRTAACGASALAIAAPVLFAHAAMEALAALRDLAFGVGGSLGTMLLSTAILACLTVCVSSGMGNARVVRAEP